MLCCLVSSTKQSLRQGSCTDGLFQGARMRDNGHKAGKEGKLIQGHILQGPPLWLPVLCPAYNSYDCISGLFSAGNRGWTPAYFPNSGLCTAASCRPQGKEEVAQVCTSVRWHLWEAVGTLRETASENREMYKRCPGQVWACVGSAINHFGHIVGDL